jgi:drug/metabolite transporter (DMT)-like permease
VRLGSWSRDETVGKALIAAGAVFLAVQLLPAAVVGALRKLWPLALIAAGALLIWRKPR